MRGLRQRQPSLDTLIPFVFFKTYYLFTPNVESLRAFRVDSGEIPATFLQVCRAMHHEAKLADFVSSRVYLVEDPALCQRLILCYRKRDGSMLLVIQIFDRVIKPIGRPEAFRESTLISVDNRGRFSVATNSLHAVLDSGKFNIRQMVPDENGDSATLADLVQLHDQCLDKDDRLAINNHQQAEQILEQFHQLSKNELLENGIFEGHVPPESPPPVKAVEPVTLGEREPVTLEEPVAEPDRRPQHTSVFYKSVMDEIERIQRSKSTLKSALLFLVLSIAAFVIAGYLAWDLQFLLLLIPVMFFHELGHFLAMRIFGYKDVKMFFVPLLGAAVSGKNFNVAGWKKVLVFLAGPLPGLVLAVPMAVCANLWQMPVLRQLTIINVVINVLNLLPIVPLDGGRIMHAMFFCRNAMLDGIFHVVGALLLIVVGALSGAWFFAGLGGFLLLGASNVFKNASVAQTLKNNYGAAIINDHQDIPESTARLIIDELPTEGAWGQPKILATRTLQIFENINARPPGALATVGLSMLYGLGWLAGAAALFILFALPPGSTPNLVLDAMTRPVEFSIPVGQVEYVDESDKFTHNSFLKEENQDVLIGQYQDHDSASGIYQQLLTDFPAVARTGRAGATVWLRSGTEDETPNNRSPAHLLERTATTFRQLKSDGVQIFSLEVDTADEATARLIASQLKLQTQYGTLGNAIEPWAPQYSISDAQKKARHTLVRLMEIEQTVANDSQLNEAYQKLEQIEDEAVYEKSLQAWTTRSDDLRIEQMQMLKSDPNYDAVLIDFYASPEHLQNRNRIDPPEPDQEYEGLRRQQEQWARSLGEMLGAWPTDSETAEVNPVDLRYRIRGGFAHHQGKRLFVRNMVFDDPFEGFFALLRWIDGQSRSKIKVTVIDLGNVFRSNADANED